MEPPLWKTLLFVAEHLNDDDTAKLPNVMADQHDLSPTSPEWLENWELLLANPIVLSHLRPYTRKAIMAALQTVYDSVKDMPKYRKPLAELVFDFCYRQATEGGDDDDEGMWKILGDEIVFRVVEAQDKSPSDTRPDEDDIQDPIENCCAVGECTSALKTSHFQPRIPARI